MHIIYRDAVCVRERESPQKNMKTISSSLVCAISSSREKVHLRLRISKV
jgi:hypothetical protein